MRAMARASLSELLFHPPTGQVRLASVFADAAGDTGADADAAGAQNGTAGQDDAAQAPQRGTVGQDELEGPSTGQEDMPEREGVGIVDTRAMHAQKRGKVRNFKEYHMMVDTGTSPTSMTHGDVFIQLIGNRGKTGLLHLAKGLGAGSRSEYSVFAKDVGRVERIHVAADTTDRWFCDRLWLSGPEGMREFPVGQYLGWPNNPEVTVSPLYASMGPAGILLGAAVSAAMATVAKDRRKDFVGGQRAAGLSSALQMKRASSFL